MNRSQLTALRNEAKTRPREVYRALGFEPHKVREGEARGACPLHGGSRPDSFSLALVGERAGQWYCHSGCQGGGDVIDFAGIQDHGAAWDPQSRQQFGSTVARLSRALGLEAVEAHDGIVATYDYTDESGSLLFQVVRFHPKAFRQRQPGSKAGDWRWDLNGVRRVLYHLQEITERPEETVFLVEGEKDADRLSELGVLTTTAPMGAGFWRAEFSDQLADRRVVVIPDADDAGRKGASKQAHALAPVASDVRVLELPGLSNGQDVSDWIEAGGTRDELLRLVALVPARSASTELAGPEGQPATPALYRETDQGLVFDRPSPNGVTPVALTNFTARITADIYRDDGVEGFRHFVIKAHCRGRTSSIEVPAAGFKSMAWVETHLGSAAIVYAGHVIKDHARTAIQSLSGEAEQRVIYAHTGWRELDEGWTYLHASGAIGANGLVPDVTVELPAGADRYRLPAPPSDDEWATAIETCLRFLDLGPDDLVIPVFAMIWRSTLAQSPFAVHITGRTGTFKSQLAALAAQFFGPGMIAEHLPGSWSSTGNALEGTAFALKDALFVIDDFAPGGSASDAQRLHREAARLFRGQANGAGRGRMRADTSLRPEKPPRGSVLSTGEDIPRDHSILARLLVLEIEPNAIQPKALSACQADAAEGAYALAMAGFLHRLASRYAETHRKLAGRVRELRDGIGRSGQHRRTATTVAELLAGLDVFLEIAGEHGALPIEQVDELRKRSRSALLRVGEAQSALQESADPVVAFMDLLSSALGSGAAHVASRCGGVPATASAWGWRTRTQPGVLIPEGTRIGWVDGEDLFLDVNAACQVVQTMTSTNREPVSLSSRTLSKRLHEAGLLKSTEKAPRETLLIRRTLEGTRRTVLHLSASPFLPEPDPPDPEPQFDA